MDNKQKFLEDILNFLQGQWDTLGISGRAQVSGVRVIDPEALLLFTLDIARFDPRMFDQVLDWLVRNGHRINVRRLRTMSGKYTTLPMRVLGAISEILQGTDQTMKWKTIALSVPGKLKKSTVLFLKPDGTPLPLSGKNDKLFGQYGIGRPKYIHRGMPIDIREQINLLPCLLFKLRSIFGVNSRADIVSCLLARDEATASEMGRITFYSQKSVEEVLKEMESSGIVVSRTDGRRKPFRISDKSHLWKLLGYDEPQKIEWVNWFTVFSALSTIWWELSEPGFEDRSTYIQSSELRKLMDKEGDKIASSGLYITLNSSSAYPGEDYLTALYKDLGTILRMLAPSPAVV